jgi:hypothetical protein
VNPGLLHQQLTVDDADVLPAQQTKRLAVLDVALFIAIAAMTGGWVCALGWVAVQLVALI